MAPRRYTLELFQTSQRWQATLTPLPAAHPLPGREDEALERLEFGSPLELLEWLQRDLPPTSDPPDLR